MARAVPGLAAALLLRRQVPAPQWLAGDDWWVPAVALTAGVSRAACLPDVEASAHSLAVALPAGWVPVRKFAGQSGWVRWWDAPVVGAAHRAVESGMAPVLAGVAYPASSVRSSHNR